MNILEIFRSPFFISAMLAGLLSSIASGIVGSYVVTKRIIFLSGSIAHSVLSGMGFFLWLKIKYHIAWLEPIYGAFLAAIISALIIGWIHLNYQKRKDSVIASIWASGMAIGVIFISVTPGYNVELFNFLFGNILWVASFDLWMLCFLNVTIISVVWLLYRPFLAICFDEKQAKLQKIPVKRLYLTLLVLVAICIVILIQVIGIILVIALLTLPPTIASFFTHRLSTMMFLAIIFCGIFNFLGLVLSYELNWPSGATIALTTTFIYFLILTIKPKTKKYFCKKCPD